MGNLHKHYYNMLGKENFNHYLWMLELFLSKEYLGTNPHVKASFMDLLFTLNIMEKGRIVSEIEEFLKNPDDLKEFV